LSSETLEAQDALASDDQCADGEAGCALNAMQLRGALLGPDDTNHTENLDSMASRHHHHQPKQRDIDKWTGKRLKEKVGDLAKNISAMEQKLAYLAEDLESAKQRVLGIPNAPVGVNDTVVDWSKHTGDWIPTFALVEEQATTSQDDVDLSLEDPDEDKDDEATLHQASATGKTLKRARRVKSELKVQTMRMQAVAGEMVYLKGNTSWLNEFIANRPRYLNGRLVLAETGEQETSAQETSEQEASEEETATRERVSTNRRRRSEPENVEQPKDPREDIEDRLEEAWNTADALWAKFFSIGLEAEAVKRRVVLWEKANSTKPATPLY